MPAHFEAYWTASLLPGANATPWELVVEAVDSHLVARDPVFLIQAARDPQTAPLALLPYLAMERSVLEFDTSWPESQQRAVIASSFAFHRIMGTRRALDLALAPLGYALTVKEWFETSPQGAPYTFSIAVQIGQQTAWALADFQQVVRIANRAKNAHTLLTALSPARSLGPAGVSSAGWLSRIRSMTVSQIVAPPQAPTEIDQTLQAPSAITRVAAALSRKHWLRILPRLD